MRTLITKEFYLSEATKAQLLIWAQQFEEVLWLDSNDYPHKNASYDAILAVDAAAKITSRPANAFAKLEDFYIAHKDWIFGYLGYDLKNDVEDLSSNNFDGLGFPELYFFQPKRLFLFSKEQVTICYLEEVAHTLETDWKTILATQPVASENEPSSEVKIRLRTSKDSYFDKVGTLLKHIERGDIYEANFCQEFYAEDTSIEPIRTFHHLNRISLPPFAVFLKLDQCYALSASPERYLLRNDTTVISQPIKGTAKRLKNRQEDAQMAKALANDPKERSENIMITDLVRNDLSRFALKGSVTVEELCKVYSFEQVHQMISTIRCEVVSDTSSVQIIKDTFPMGSMTGAPKISAMKIIETLEDAKRGLYSGAIGYFTPNGNFDFNVVIRSIFYNANRRYVSYSVGGAITINSVIEKEYEECLLKAKAMREALGN